MSAHEPSPRALQPRLAGGFTLIEVLVAVFIFSVIAVMAYGGYNDSARQAEISKAQMQRLEQLQTTVRLMTQDFEQLAPRPVRDLLGQGLENALNSDARSDYVVALTRAGWSNPAGTQRSTLQRVHYVLKDNKLRREHGSVLDATLANEPVKRELIDKVEELHIRYMDANKQWQEQWPPLNTQQVAGMTRSRPVAIEVTLILEDYGEIKRLIEVGG